MMLNLPPRISDWLLHLVESQSAVAFLHIDGEEILVATGGDLDNYGLTDLHLHRRAGDQVSFLEGLLPLEEATFIIHSMEMPSGRSADVHLLSDEAATWVVFLDVTSEHDTAQKIQQKAYDMTLLSQREARLIVKLDATNKELTAAHRNLAESREALLRTHNRMQEELREAERYVRAILPAPITKPFAVDWLYVPSTELAGDSLGYHWIDAEHFALYLLDVSGHGVGSALLSVAAAQTLRSGTLRDADLRLPEEVLASLNQIYRMEQQNNLYFTIWYGVYHQPTKRLRYASAGHPAPVLFSGTNGRLDASLLQADGVPVGMIPNVRYDPAECTLASPAKLFLFSDGVTEISRPDGTMLEFTDFHKALAGAVACGQSEMDELLRMARELHGDAVLEDDFSIIKMTV
jgi:serine phosphatase RsbU (regulator of sigma subunit)